MKHPTFLEGVAVALIASLVGGALYSALSSVFASGSVLRPVIAGIGFAYVVYLLGRSREPVGRITTLAIWALVAGAAWFMHPPLTLYVLVHLGAIWLIRSLYFYSSVLSALADLGLNALGLAAAIWAVKQSGSLFASIWCFFLVQALFVAIPARLSRKTEKPDRDSEDRFQHAHRAAEMALRKLSSIH